MFVTHMRHNVDVEQFVIMNLWGVGWGQNNFNKINWERLGEGAPPPYQRHNHRTGSDTLPNIIHTDPIYL